jgi:hypothetical protein
MKPIEQKLKFIFNKKKFLTTLACVFLYSISNAQILNGSFEADPITPLPAGPSAFSTIGTLASLTNWTNSSTTSNINIHHSSHWGMGSAAGTYHIDLNITGQIQQTGIALIGGTTYALNFSTSLHAVMASAGVATADLQLLQSGGAVVIPATTITKTKTTASGTPQGWVANPTINFTAPATGNYTLLVRGLTSNYSSGGVLVDNFSIIPACTPFNASISGATIACAGQSKTLTASPAGMTSYTWQPGGATGQTFSTGALAATKTFTVTVKDANNCTQTATHTVTIVPPCVVSISFDKKVVCKDSATLTANVFGDGCTTDWANNTKKVGPGTYTVTATNAAGCTSTASITITSDPCCYDVDFCYHIQNQTLTIQSVTPASNVAGSTYLYKWSFGDGSSSNVKYPGAKTYINEGDYNVCLEVKKVFKNTNDTCCWKICKKIHLVPSCNATVFNADMDYSLIGSTLIPAKGANFKAPVGTQMKISYGTPSIADVIVPITVANSIPTPPTSITKTYTQPGIYEYCVSLSYTNAYGDNCFDSRCKTVVVDTPCATQASFNIKACANSTAYEFMPVGNALSAIVTWDFGNGKTGTSNGNTSIFYTYPVAGIYKVCMQVIQGKCTSRTCFYVYANPVEFVNCSTGAIPTVASKPAGESNFNDIDANKFLLVKNSANEKLTSIAFPNPTTNELNVVMTATEAKQVQVEVMTIDGKVIYASTENIGTENSKLKINTTSFENGMYMIRIKSADQINLHKIVVAR